MLRITIELIPFGLGKPQHLGTLHLANDGTGTQDRGNYDGTLFTKTGAKMPQRVVRVEDWPRQSRPVWELVIEALQSAGYSARRKVTSGSDS